ncbi:ODA6 [Scenedesmus sp. PABB004]|nr:ODA6 [Scenedesmus sp. PABB004]
MEIYYQYARPRRQFGRHPRFVDEGAEMVADIRPNEDHARECVPRNPVTTGAQCVPEMSEHEANTLALTYAHKAVSHTEGGWPKDVDHTEAEHTIRFRKKVEKDEDYIRTVVALGASIEGLNNAIDIYEEYFVGYAADHSGEPPSARSLTVLKDPAPAPRPVAHVAWLPDGGGRAVVCYGSTAFQAAPSPGVSTSSYVWDLANPTAPDAELAPSSALLVSRFNAKDGALLGGGQYNGQFAVFDTRKGAAPVDVTPMDVSHTDPIFDFAWLQSKSGAEAMSVSTDGSVLWWDIRKLSEAVEAMPLREKGGDALLGGVSLEYDPAAGPAKFMVGCESGTVLSCNRKAKQPADRVTASYGGHHGPVYGLRRHPFFPKYFLSVGDWTARIWNEDVRAPLLVTPHSRAYLTAGSWSPSRPGVFFTAHSDGLLSAWDVFHKHNAPSLTVQVSDQALTAFAIQDGGGVVAAGSADGRCAVLALSASLVEAGQNEKQGIGAMLERETLREKNFEKAAKEAKVKARREAARHSELPDGVTDDDLAELEDAFAAQAGLEPGPGVRLLAARSGARRGSAGGEQAGGGGAGDAQQLEQQPGQLQQQPQQQPQQQQPPQGGSTSAQH